MKRTGKGTRNEKKCEDTLKEIGYITWRVRRNRFANMDMFGLFDVVGWDRGRADILFVQVKSNRVDKKTLDNIKDFNIHSPVGCHGEAWVWIDRKGWEIYQ